MNGNQKFCKDCAYRYIVGAQIRGGEADYSRPPIFDCDLREPHVTDTTCESKLTLEEMRNGTLSKVSG
jgi:hypothetical protein